MIDWAVATQTNGVAEALYASTNAWLLPTRSGTPRNEPRTSARWPSRPNHRSTLFSQEEHVGVKCRWKRGRAASQRLTLACLCVA